MHKGRVDFIVSDELVGWELIKELFPNESYKFGTMEKNLNEDELKLMVSREYADTENILKKFNLGLEKIIQNKKYSLILKKYNIKE